MGTSISFLSRTLDHLVSSAQLLLSWGARSTLGRQEQIWRRFALLLADSGNELRLRTLDVVLCVVEELAVELLVLGIGCVDFGVLLLVETRTCSIRDLQVHPVESKIRSYTTLECWAWLLHFERGSLLQEEIVARALLFTHMVVLQALSMRIFLGLNIVWDLTGFIVGILMLGEALDWRLN